MQIRTTTCLFLGIHLSVLTGCLDAPPEDTSRERSSSGIVKLAYTPVTPCRIVDTREAGDAFTAGEARAFVVHGDVAAQGGSGAGCSSPVGEPHAVQLNVTVLPKGTGHLKVLPAGASLPYGSFVNFKAGLQAVANAGIAKTCVDCDADISVKVQYGAADVVIDVLGYFAPTSAAGSAKKLVYSPVTPCRLADTRVAGGELAPDEKRSLQVYGAVGSQGGSSSCSAPRGEPLAAHLKVVAVPSSSGAEDGSVAVFPKGSAAPPGLLRYQEGGQNIANAAIVPTLVDDTAPEIELLNRGGNVHLVVDVLGYYYEQSADPPAGQDLLYAPVAPCRIADTRKAGGVLKPDEQRSLRVHGATADQGGQPSCSAPAGEPRAAHLDVVAVPRVGYGNIALDAAGAGAPWVGALNYHAGYQNIADAVTVRTAYGSASAADITVRNRHGQADVVIDVLGYFYAADDEPGPAIDGVINLTADHERAAVEPAVSVAGVHRWVAWVEYSHTANSALLRATRFDGAAQVVGPLEVSNPARILSPQVVAEDNGDAWFFWVEVGTNGGRLKARHRAAGGWDSAPIDVVAGKAGYPAAHLDGSGQPWVVFESYHGGGVEVREAHWTGSGFSSPVRLSQAAINAYQPAIELDAEQALWVVWHAYKDGNYDIFARRRQAGGSFGATWQITDATSGSQHLGFHVNPTIHKGCCGVVWIGWVTKGPDARIAGTKPHLYGWVQQRRLQLRRVKPNGSRDPIHQVPVPFASTKHSDSRISHAGPESITIANSPGKIGVFYRLVTNSGQNFNWRAFVQHMTVSDGRWRASPLEVSGGGLTAGQSEPPVAAQTAGGILVAWQQDNRADFRLYDGFAEPQSDVLVREIPADALSGATVQSQPLQTYKMPLRFDAPRAQQTTVHQGKTLQLLYGDLHGHTQFSHCSTVPEHPLREGYRAARDMAALDFYVATDHDHHMSHYDWWEHQNQCYLHQGVGQTALLGLEHTSHQHGHLNVIYDDCAGKNLSHYSFTPEQLFSALPAGKSIAIPHHPSFWQEWAWWDMRRFNPSYNRLYEIYQVRGSFECYECVGVYRDLYVVYPDAPGKGFKSIPPDPGQGRGYFQDALAKGHRIGVIASPDHGGTWGVAGVYAASRSPKDLFEALWARRTFGVSNAVARLALELRADGHIMGEAYSKSSGACPTLTGRVSTDYVDPTTGAQATIKQIKIFRVDVGKPIPGEHGEVFKLTPSSEKEVTFSYHDAGCPGSGSAAYYLRAIQSDVSGVDVPKRPSIGWTSPVFVDWN